MEIQGIMVNPTITYPLLVSPKEAEQGVVVVDLGAEVTDVTIVRDNRVQFFRSLPFGAELIDADLKSILPKGTNVSKIKHVYGKAISSNVADTEVIKDGTREIIHRNIATVIEARLMDIAEVVGKVVAESGFGEFIPHGYVLTGGSAMIDMVDALFERELNRPCRKAETLYGIGKIPQECEITPGQHAALAIMLNAAQLSASYVKELDVVDNKTPKPEPVQPKVRVTTPQPKAVVAPEPEVQPEQADVEPEVTPEPIDVVCPKPKSETKKGGKKGGMFDKLAGFISRTLGSDDKEK